MIASFSVEVRRFSKKIVSHMIASKNYTGFIKDTVFNIVRLSLTLKECRYNLINMKVVLKHFVEFTKDSSCFNIRNKFLLVFFRRFTCKTIGIIQVPLDLNIYKANSFGKSMYSGYRDMCMFMVYNNNYGPSPLPCKLTFSSVRRGDS